MTVAVFKPMFSTLVVGPSDGASEDREIKKTKVESQPGRSVPTPELLPLFKQDLKCLGWNKAAERGDQRINLFVQVVCFLFSQAYYIRQQGISKPQENVLLRGPPFQ